MVVLAETVVEVMAEVVVESVAEVVAVAKAAMALSLTQNTAIEVWSVRGKRRPNRR